VLAYRGVSNLVVPSGSVSCRSRASRCQYLTDCRGTIIAQNWQATAFNQVPYSANEIHGDKIVKAYGVKGGLVPGVTVSAYLCHPAVESWGADCLDESVGAHGYAVVKLCAHADGYSISRGNGSQRFVNEKKP
jgi:hypothetical protein